MSLLHHCTFELFLTVVIGGTVAILLTVFLYEKK